MKVNLKTCEQCQNGTYHRELGLPADAAALWAGDLALCYSSHARAAAQEDRYGAVPLFEWVEFEAGDVVEVEVEQGRAVKAVVRIPFNDSLDLVYVLLRPASRNAFVKTVWFNSSSDKHKTLNKQNYEKIN